MLHIFIYIYMIVAAESPQVLWRGTSGTISFTSDAPLEIISAQSNELQGVIDPEENTYAFSVYTASFEGFNSSLQQEHFHENYMESSRYPTASFSGRFIEDINELPEGISEVRAKGMLKIHGVAVERIIKCTLILMGKKVEIKSKFQVPLTDHDITIPQVVHQKIAEEILVSVNLSLDRQ